MNESQKANMFFAFEKFLKSHHPFTVRQSLQPQTKSGKITPHKHDFPQLWYCIEGSCYHSIGDNLFECKAGSLVIIPPGYKHFFETKRGETARLICLEGTFFFFNAISGNVCIDLLANSFLHNFVDETGYEPKFCIHFRNEEKKLLDELFSELAQSDYRTNSPNIEKIKSRISYLFSLREFALSEKQYSACAKTIKSKLEPIMNVMLFLNENFNKKIVGTELVKISAMCYSDFFKYFKRIFGMTYTAYLNELRLRRAIMFLAYTNYTFEYIADLCGFYDRTYMGKLFKKRYGRTLTEERKLQPRTKANNPTMHITHDFLHSINIDYKI